MNWDLNWNDITLCFVTLERANYLAKSLSSVPHHPKIIVYDNGTTTATNKALIKAYALKSKAKYIRVEKNEGLPKAWNQCIIQSTTDWVALCPDDIIFRTNWFESVKKILQEEKPNAKIIFGNNYDMILLHKSIIPVIGWLEEGYKQYPSSEDYDAHLRLTEVIGFSPYTMPGDHVQGIERKIRMTRANQLTKEEYMSDKNFTYWCTSPFSEEEPLCNEIPHPKTANYFKKDPDQETGYDFHKTKWEVCDKNNKKALLNIDGQVWKRLKNDVDPYPEITKEYKDKYL